MRYTKEYFIYDNPEYQGLVGAQAAGWHVRGGHDQSGNWLVERLSRVEGLCDPDFRQKRIPPDRHVNAPYCENVGTAGPMPDWYKRGLPPPD